MRTPLVRGRETARGQPKNEIGERLCECIARPFASFIDAIGFQYLSCLRLRALGHEVRKEFADFASHAARNEIEIHFLGVGAD